jgi:glycosyltransferase involved in cell wall biosynthesis
MSIFKAAERPFVVALRSLARRVNRVASRYDPVQTRFVSLSPAGNVRGRALVAHVAEGIMLAPDDPLIASHNHFVEARLLAEVLLEQGYAVDFIDYRNRWFSPRTDYDLFISPRGHFERLAARMRPGCIKIVHLETAHWLFNNRAALNRIHEVQERRGVALPSYARIEEGRAIEAADYATMLGNEFVYDHYAYAGKKVFQLPNPPSTTFDWDDAKDFAACRTRFLWLGSRGLVHKGLDLVLEAFARLPDLHLTVCGPIDQDPHFVAAFRKELYETPNIRVHGWIDVTGPEFKDLAQRTIAHVYPSCAEGCAGAVVNCMHAGLIPVATRQSGIDIAPSFGIELGATRVENVESAVRRLAGLPADRLAAMARESWEQARRVYSRERYKSVLAAALQRIVADHPHGASPGFVPMERLGDVSIVGDERAALHLAH